MLFKVAEGFEIVSKIIYSWICPTHNSWWEDVRYEVEDWLAVDGRKWWGNG